MLDILTFYFHFPSDTQSDPDFSIVARVEAFIAGWGLDEALKRSEAYLNAGADAILMHSKNSDPSDIEAFVKAWNNQVHFIIFMQSCYRFFFHISSYCEHQMHFCRFVFLLVALYVA